jgi:hypothetical protein
MSSASTDVDIVNGWWLVVHVRAGLDRDTSVEAIARRHRRLREALASGFHLALEPEMPHPETSTNRG